MCVSVCLCVTQLLLDGFDNPYENLGFGAEWSGPCFCLFSWPWVQRQSHHEGQSHQSLIHKKINFVPHTRVIAHFKGLAKLNKYYKETYGLKWRSRSSKVNIDETMEILLSLDYALFEILRYCAKNFGKQWYKNILYIFHKWNIIWN